jgi:hypothetical protein
MGLKRVIVVGLYGMVGVADGAMPTRRGIVGEDMNDYILCASSGVIWGWQGTRLITV